MNIMKNRHTTIATTALLVFASAGIGAASAGEATQATLLSQAKITQAAAQKIALAKVPMGKLHSSELENEHGKLVWSFDIAMPGSRNITEILVDARTGKIVHSEIETPRAQAKEAATDKLEKKKS